MLCATLKHAFPFPFMTFPANRGQYGACVFMSRADTPTTWQRGHLQRAWSVALTVNILITGNHIDTLAMPQSRVLLLWPRVSAHSVLVKIACRNKLWTQKGNPADLLNVPIRSHSSSVIIHQCGKDDRQNLHQFKRKREESSFLVDFSLCQTDPVCCSDVFSPYFLQG